VDVLHGLDEMRLAQDEVRVVRFLDFHRDELHDAPPIPDSLTFGTPHRPWLAIGVILREGPL
jgi:hypothetical protein